MNNKPQYSANWFFPTNIDKYLGRLGTKDLHFLEIGSFEGLGTNYLIDKFLFGPTSKITCIDPWIKYSEATVTSMEGHDDLINEETYNIFIQNTEKNKDKIIVMRGLSKDIIPTLTEKYDFIFVDGDHSEDAVWLDAIQGFEKLKPGGIIIFDDYMWVGNGGESSKSPYGAINKFMSEYEDKLEVLAINSQVVVQKIKD